MKYLKSILIILLALSLVFFDVAFFSNFQMFNTTFISSFAVLIVFALVSKPRKYLVYILPVILAFTALSSLPIVLIYLNFLVLPLFVSYLRKNYFPEPTIATSVFYFFLCAFIFEFSLLIYTKSWNVSGFVAVLAFMITNTVFGVVIYALTQRLRRDFVSAKIKL